MHVPLPLLSSAVTPPVLTPRLSSWKKSVPALCCRVIDVCLSVQSPPTGERVETLLPVLGWVAWAGEVGCWRFSFGHVWNGGRLENLLTCNQSRNNGSTGATKAHCPGHGVLLLFKEKRTHIVNGQLAEIGSPSGNLNKSQPVKTWLLCNIRKRSNLQI